MLKAMLTIGLTVLVLGVAEPAVAATTVPDTIRIDSLAHSYAAVTFNHGRHITYQRDCAVCHHHTNGAPARDSRCLKCHRGGHEAATMACRGCHRQEPFSAAALQEQFRDPQRHHLDKPGLKAAYHLGCLGCHRRQGGPTGCTDCHALADAGQALYRSGPHAPKKTARTGHGEH